MRTVIIAVLSWVSFSSGSKADVHYCKATATALIVLHEIEGRPIYTQSVDPNPETLMFNREGNNITIKAEGEYIMKIHDGVFPKKDTSDYFLASRDGKFGADSGFGMTGYFEYFDGSATFHRGNTISTFQCNKF